MHDERPGSTLVHFFQVLGDPREDVARERPAFATGGSGRHVFVGESLGEDPPLRTPAPDVLEDHVRGHGLRPGVERAVAAIAVDRPHDLEERELREILVVGVAPAQQLADGAVDLHGHSRLHSAEPMAEFPARALEISAWSSSARDDGVPGLGARSRRRGH